MGIASTSTNPPKRWSKYAYCFVGAIINLFWVFFLSPTLLIGTQQVLLKVNVDTDKLCTSASSIQRQRRLQEPPQFEVIYV